MARAACVASHTAHAEACLSARQHFLATEFPVTPVAVFLVLDWCCAVHGSDKMALRVRRVMARARARAKARVIMVSI